MGDDVTALHKRLEELEAIERDYLQLKRLIQYATNNQSLDHYMGTLLLYVDPLTRRILDANAFATETLGYSLEQLQAMSIDELEDVYHDHDHQPATYVETSYKERYYTSLYRHHSGYHLSVHVRKRVLEQAGKQVWLYSLEDDSLHRQAWHQLSRREDAGFQFQQKLKTLNEINFHLNRIDDFNDLCWQGVKLGIERLGFDRISLWFFDKTRHVMVGSYGVDENGQIRAEHHQSWSFDGTHVIDFLAGHTSPVITHDKALLYNEKSEVVGHGWHIAVPMLNGDEFIGFMAADNYIHGRIMKNYEPELLQMYGITIGHMAALIRARTQKMELRFQEERLSMLKTFIVDVGHDFRTPLAIINTNSYLIEKLKDEARKKALLTVIQEQALYVTNMMNDMLEIVKLEYDLQLEATEIEAASLLISTAHRYNAFAASKQIEWELEAEPAVKIKGDEHYLSQALGNILKNAIQYSPLGGRVSTRLTSDDKRVFIHVQDTGPGIDSEHLDKIFKPLYRVNSARTDRGSGLGLSIAKIIVEAHHGHIDVETTLGTGSTFTMILPKANNHSRI